MNLKIPILLLSLLFNNFPVSISRFLLVAQVAEFDWLSSSGKVMMHRIFSPSSNPYLGLVQRFNGPTDRSWIFVSHEARTVCHSSASGYGTHKMDIRTGYDWMD